MQHNEQKNSSEHTTSSRIIVFLFQPDNDFYKSSFEVRLTRLTEAIEESKKILKKMEPSTKGIFVAPEYLFKDFTHGSMTPNAPKRYFSHQDKKTFVETLLELSKDTRLILAPGTFCWKKQKKKQAENTDENTDSAEFGIEDKAKLDTESDVESDTYYRNALYFFHQGKIEKLKKAYPQPQFDFDFRGDEFNFKRGLRDDPIKNFDGMRIGAEICYDNYVKRLIKTLSTPEHKDTKLDVHLVVADGVGKLNVLPQDNVLTIKVERNPDSRKPNVFGVIYNEKNSSTQELEPPLKTHQVNADLTYYEFQMRDRERIPTYRS